MAGADIFFPQGGDVAGGTAVPTGVVLPYAAPASSIPAGWVLCDGSALSRTAYATLYSAIGTTFGNGDGTTTFNLPNLQGRVPMGSSGGHALASTGGEERHTLTTSEVPDTKLANADYPTDVLTAAGDANDGPLNGFSGRAPNFRGIGGGSHNNMQPYLTLNYIIKT